MTLIPAASSPNLANSSRISRISAPIISWTFTSCRAIFSFRGPEVLGANDEEFRLGVREARVDDLGEVGEAVVVLAVAGR